MINKRSICTSIYVLENPFDLAREMIENGQQKESFYICDMDILYRNFLQFKNIFPRVKIFYAMKCNDTEIMLKLSVAMGAGFACASPQEIYTIRQMNVNAKSIFYYMPKKTPEQMLYAKQTGVGLTSFDSSNELAKLKENWPNARLLIHIKIGEKTTKKFGCDFETEAFDLLDEAASLGLTVVGVSFHIGSSSEYAGYIKLARALFNYEQRARRIMNVVHIGGLISDCTQMFELSQTINDALSEYFPEPKVHIISTPDTYLCQNGFTLYCSISGVRTVTKCNNTVNMIYLNDGVYGTMRFTHGNQLSLFKRTGANQIECLEDTILWGPTCDSLDQVMKDAKLVLPRCNHQDWLVIKDNGAHSFTYSTEFSSIPLPLIRPVISKKLWWLLKEKTIFSSTEFIDDPNISTLLPSTLPPVLSTGVYEHLHLPTLHV